LITTDEMAYLHDLSIFVGKKYVDSLESLQSTSQNYKSEEEENENFLKEKNISFEDIIGNP